MASQSSVKARTELERIGEDPEVIDWYCRVIDEFHSFGHSGGSFYATMPVLILLLEQKSLSPLTNDPNEWVDVAELSAGVTLWQNNRNGEAFSTDSGNTYTLTSDKTVEGEPQKFYTSLDIKKIQAIKDELNG